MSPVSHPPDYEAPYDDAAAALFDYGGAIRVCKSVEPTKVLTVTTDKRRLKVNAVEATNTTGNAEGKKRTSTDDTTDIVGITIPVV